MAPATMFRRVEAPVCALYYKRFRLHVVFIRAVAWSYFLRSNH